MSSQETEKLSYAIVKCPQCQGIDMHVHGWKDLQIVCTKCNRIVEHAKSKGDYNCLKQ